MAKAVNVSRLSEGHSEIVTYLLPLLNRLRVKVLTSSRQLSLLKNRFVFGTICRAKFGTKTID